ncbi:hypothetical protein BDV25DRAFT_154053 [Aspergillus avenaceus]|uniref:DUF6604 domain-containing protein n=1 Tax=Aspergillus avenaceus TaxID=36643 RepID=A0A5N6TWJ5_ASPAV|nr:hypothetical protein BDV25DRAFT_154053 [Aspergillus avenaceus]
MLPTYLQSSYVRYKNDTNTFATWLLEAASKCGYQPDGLTSTVPSGKEGKRKSKTKAVNPSSDTPQYITTIKELQATAELVAKSTLAVPSPVLTIAKRAIKLRKDVTSWFLGQGDTESNIRHAHFVSALERICDTLEWRTNESVNPHTRNPPPPSETPDDDADLDMFMNKFAVLTVEEPSIEEREESPKKFKTSSELQKVVKVELAENDEDGATESYFGPMFFKAFCLFQDLHTMRAFISRTWSEYRDKKIDLMNAALVTDCALQLARDMAQEVEGGWETSILPQDLDFQELIFNAACITRGSDLTPSAEIGLPYNKQVADVADLCYVPTRVLLESFANVLLDNHLPIFKKGHFGTYNPKAKREAMSLSQKFNEDKILLLQILPEFCMIDAFQIVMLSSDQITRGLVEFCKTKKVDPWLCFASQIFLDVHHIMRYSPLSAFADLRISGLRIQKTIDDYFRLSKTHPQPRFWPKEGDKEIKNIHLAVEAWIIQDLFSDLKRKSRSFPQHAGFEKHVLLSQHSILCGLSLFHLNMRMQSVGQQLITQWYDVQQLAFLYNLVRTQTHKNLDWPDMEAFIKIHGESHIFVGTRPNSARESLNRLELATGISSAANFARDSRNRQVFHRPNGNNARVVTSTTTFSNMFRAQYVAGFQEIDGSGNIDKVLDKLAQEPWSKSTGMEPQPSHLQIMFQRKWSHKRNIGTLQLLALLKSRLAEEEPLILFNYFGMHKRSVELLRLIKAKEHHKFVQYFTEGYMPDDSMISNIVILIHHVARGSAAESRALGIAPKASSGSEVISRIVMSCGDVMKEYLQRNGDVACKELRAFSRNKRAIQDEIDDDRDTSREVQYWFSLEEALDPKALASLMTGIPIA